MLRLVKETRCYRLTQHLTLACKMPSNYFNNTSNQTNLNASFIYWPGYILLPSAVRYFQLSVQVFIAFFGIFGNVLVCITVSQRKSLRSTTNFYLLSLAVADIGVLMINFPLAIFKSYFIWPFGEAFCLYIYPMTDVFFGASIWSIAVIAIERSCCTTTRHLRTSYRLKQHGPKSYARWVLLLVWSVSLLAAAIPSYLITRYSKEHNACYPHWPSDATHFGIYKQVHILAMLFLWYVIPLVLIICSAMRITKHLNTSSAFHRAMESEWLPQSNQAEKSCFLYEERKRIKQNMKAKKLLTPVVLVFCITMLPLHAFHLVALYCKEFVSWKFYIVMFNIVILFVISNSALNPLVYCMVSREFRTGFHNILLGHCSNATKSPVRSQHPQRVIFSQTVLAMTPRSTSSYREKRNKKNVHLKTEEFRLVMVSSV